MNLHENKALFRDAVQATAQEMGIPDIYVEKDYWVTFVLKTIFADPIGKETVFKGGTSLLKCYSYLKRFSEDVDLVVMRQEGETDSRLTAKIKRIGKLISGVLPEVDMEGITHKRGMNRKTAHTYQKEFEGEYGQVRDVIVLESTWFGYYEPYSTRTIHIFIYSMMEKAGQQTLTETFELLPFQVNVLLPQRTLCEKIMSLVRFSYTKTPIDDLRSKIRHTYDLHQMLSQEDLQLFFDSSQFEEMLVRVAAEDKISFRNNNEWLKYHPNNSLMFFDVDRTWESLKAVYNGTFRSLVFGGSVPEESDVLDTLKRIRTRMESIPWTS